VSRIQLALNVADLDAAVEFYSTLFRGAPAKIRPGYANFAVEDPPLKLVLIESADATPGTINHLGIEVTSSEDVREARARLAGSGLPTVLEQETSCCYAVQDKVWVDGPGGEPWEIYTVLADADAPAGRLRAGAPAADARCRPGREGAIGTEEASACC